MVAPQKQMIWAAGGRIAVDTANSGIDIVASKYETSIANTNTDTFNL